MTMDTCCECWFLGTWVSRHSVGSESENWPRILGRGCDFMQSLSFDCRSGSAFSGSIGLSSEGPLSCQLCPKASVGQAPAAPGSRVRLTAPHQARAPFLVIVGNRLHSSISRPRPRPMRTPSPVPLRDVGASSPAPLLSLWSGERNVLQKTAPGGFRVFLSPRRRPRLPRQRQCPPSAPCRPHFLRLPGTVLVARGALPGVRAGVLALCRDGAPCGEAVPRPALSRAASDAAPHARPPAPQQLSASAGPAALS